MDKEMNDIKFIRWELLDNLCRLKERIKEVPKDKQEPVKKRIKRLKETIDLLIFVEVLFDKKELRKLKNKAKKYHGGK